MPRIIRKLSELENKIKRQNALKILSSETDLSSNGGQYDASIRGMRDILPVAKEPSAAWMGTENSPYRQGYIASAIWDLLPELGE